MPKRSSGSASLLVLPMLAVPLERLLTNSVLPEYFLVCELIGSAFRDDRAPSASMGILPGGRLRRLMIKSQENSRPPTSWNSCERHSEPIAFKHYLLPL